MKLRILLLLGALLISAPVVFASEHGESSEHGEATGEKKPKTEEKPSPDSAVSIILSLPEVKAWEDAAHSGRKSGTISVSGESIKQVSETSKCWVVAVSRTDGSGTRVLKRFCVTQFGREVLVEVRREDFPDETKLISYDDWRKDCAVSATSTGSC